MIQHLQHEYNKVIRPDNFVKNFNSMREFEEWCYICNIEDLKSTLVEFEKYELYEYCEVIKNVIQSLSDSYEVFKQDLTKF